MPAQLETNSPMNDDLSATAGRLQELFIARATGGGTEEMEHEYKTLRNIITAHPILKTIAPEFLKQCRTLNQFWPIAKSRAGTYSERRQFIWDEFRPLLDELERAVSPADISVASALQKFNTETVHQLWLKTLERRESDPEGAITLARTLLETVCKHILDDDAVPYQSDGDLPSLYKAVASKLNISPSQHAEPVFKQILGSCAAVVEGLGAMRNRLSDAHGQGKKPVKPAPRHAELAVNLAGAMATFLVSTHSARSSPKH